MANTQVPGFLPEHRGGATIAMTRVRVESNNTTAIFKGDAVERASTGGWIVVAAANDLFGSVMWGGASYVSSGVRLDRPYLPAATTYSGSTNDPANASYIHVVEEMKVTRFRASVDAAITLTDLGLNYNMALGAGSTNSGLSGHELTATGRATTATFPWRVMSYVVGDPKSDPDLADAHVICMGNALQEPGAGTTTGT